MFRRRPTKRDRPHSDTDMEIDWGNPLSRGLKFYWPFVPDSNVDGNSSFAGPKIRQLVPRSITGLGAGATFNGFLSYAIGGAEDGKLKIVGDPEWGPTIANATTSDYFVNADINVQAINPSPWSASFWFKMTSSAGNNPSLLNHNNSNFTVVNLGFDFDAVANKFRAYCTNGAGSYKNATSTAISGGIIGKGWYHIAGTASTGGVKLYVNGVPDGSASTTANPDTGVTGEWRVFKASGVNIGTTVGQITNVAVWHNRVLTPGEVRQLYWRPWQMIRRNRGYFITP